jgi:hypothetical protein
MEVSRITFTRRSIYIRSRHRRSLCFTIYPRATTQHHSSKEALMMAVLPSVYTLSVVDGERAGLATHKGYNSLSSARPLLFCHLCESFHTLQT